MESDKAILEILNKICDKWRLEFKQTDASPEETSVSFDNSKREDATQDLQENEAEALPETVILSPGAGMKTPGTGTVKQNDVSMDAPPETVIISRTDKNVSRSLPDKKTDQVENDVPETVIISKTPDKNKPPEDRSASPAPAVKPGSADMNIKKPGGDDSSLETVILKSKPRNKNGIDRNE